MEDQLKLVAVDDPFVVMLFVSPCTVYTDE